VGKYVETTYGEWNDEFQVNYHKNEWIPSTPQVILANGVMELYDIYETFGISEHNNVAEENPEIIETISKYLVENKIEQRHVMISE